MGAAARARAHVEFDYDVLAAALARIASDGVDALPPLTLSR